MYERFMSMKTDEKEKYFSGHHSLEANFKVGLQGHKIVFKEECKETVYYRINEKRKQKYQLNLEKLSYESKITSITVFENEVKDAAKELEKAAEDRKQKRNQKPIWFNKKKKRKRKARREEDKESYDTLYRKQKGKVHHLVKEAVHMYGRQVYNV